MEVPTGVCREKPVCNQALGFPAQLRLAGSGLAARACLYVHDRVSGWAPRKICTFRRIFSCLPGFLEKCCGLTPPFDDLAMDHTNDRCAVPPPLGGDSTATAYCLQKDHRIIYRSQCANLSFFHYLIAHSLYNGFRLKSRVKPGEMQLVAKMLLSRKGREREKEESKVPPKIVLPQIKRTVQKNPW